MIRPITTALALLCFAAAAFAQADPTLTPLAPKTGEPRITGPINPGPPAAGEASSGRYSWDSKNVMICWQENSDTAWGYSKSLGRWTKQEVNPPPQSQPHMGVAGLTTGDNIAVWRLGSAYYAFSGEVARWDVLKLPEGRTPPVVLDSTFAVVRDRDYDYTFAAATGRWSSPKEGAEATETKLTDESGIKIFTLRHAKAIEAQVLISQLFARDIHSAVADERTNSLIVRGPPEQLNIIFSILTRLDEDGGGSQAGRADGPRGGSPKGEGGMFGTIFETGPSAETVEELAKKYNDKEQEALAVARQIRELQSAPGDHKRAFVEMKGTLRRTVGEAFAARQKLHHAEVGQLQQRIAGIQKNVATRDRLSDKIIEVRVNDLLNPELQWNSRSRLPGGTLAPDAGAATTPSTSRPKLAMELWWGPESEQILQELGIQTQKLTRDDAPEPNLVGALKITAIDPQSPVKELQVGCLITGLQMTGGRVKGGRRVELHLRRGNDHFPLIVELPPRIATSNVPGPPGEASTPSDLSAQRAYRDKQRQRWEQIEQLYHGGRMEFDMMMQAAKDLADAELAAAATAEDRRAARQRSLELLKGVKSIVDAKFDHQVEPEHKKLAVDAEVLKAEAQLAADAGRVKNEQAASEWKLPTITSLPTGSAERQPLRSPGEFRERLIEQENHLARLKASDATKFSGDPAKNKKQIEMAVQREARELDFLREEYAAQIRLLELENQDAKSALEAAAQQRKQTEQEFESGHASRGNVVAQERAVQEANLRLQRSKTLLELYRKAEPKDAASAPAAEPASTPAPNTALGR